MRKTNKILLTLGAFVSIFVFAVLPASGLVSAQTNNTSRNNDNLICTIFPFIGDISLTSALCGEGGETAASTAGTLASVAQFVLSLIFVGIILIAVVTIIKAALKYIQSEGDETKVEEATKAIKNVFIGIGALIVGLIGLVLIVGLLGASDALNADTEELEGLDEGQDVLDELLGN